MLLFIVTPLVMVLVNAFLATESYDNFVDFFYRSSLDVLAVSLIVGFVTTRCRRWIPHSVHSEQNGKREK